MGALTSRQHAGVEEADVVSNHAYKYPPRSGNYFGSHFIMGGERFDTPQPEAYLFGENADLNFLGSRPTPFPYPPPQSNEPTKTLKSLVNIRKESLRFVRCPEPVGKINDTSKINDQVKSVECNGKGTYYNIEFTFDCDARCAITIFYFCTEEVTATGVVYYPRDPTMTSQTYHYKKGANQQFCQILHVFDPSKFADEDLSFSADREIIPVAIYCVVDEGQEEIRQSHTTIAVIEKHTDGTYVLKALKQKLFVDGLCYLLQEIYGIENKNLDTKPSSDEETEDGGSECVICMCDVRDTLILPCRHLCLCNSCADSLRYQANNCPICRAPFRALLQIRALQRLAGPPASPAVPPPTTSPPDGSMENIPAGYEPVSLIEALNGPPATRARPPPAAAAPAIASPDTDTASQAAEILNRCNLERSSSTSLGSAAKDDAKPHKKDPITPEFRMSVLLAREEERASPPPYSRATHASRTSLNNLNSVNSASVDKLSKISLTSEHRSEAEADAEVEAEVVEDEEEGSAYAETPEADAEPDSDAERRSPLLTQLPLNGEINIRLAFAVLSSVCWSAFQHGFNSGVTNAPQLVMSEWLQKEVLSGTNTTVPADKDPKVTPVWSVVVAMYCVGGMVGGILTGYVADRFGRKGGLLLNNVLVFIGVIFQSSSKSAYSSELLIIGRLFIGINSGLNAGLAPMYISEISPVHLRGSIGTVYQLVITLTILLSQVLGLKTVLGTESSWPYLLAVVVIPAVIQIATLPLCPESPRYLLLNKGQELHAQRALTWLRGDVAVHSEMDEMRQEAEKNKISKKVTLRELFSNRQLRQPLIIAVVVMVAQQFSGINAVIFFSTNIFSKANLSDTQAQYATLGMGAMNAVITLVSLLLVERAGRKTLLLTGFGGMLVCSIALSVAGTYITHSWVPYLCIALVIAFVVMFAVGPGSIPWFLVTELFNQSARPAASSMAVTVNWASNFIVLLSFLPLSDILNMNTFIIFAILQLIFIIFIALKVPETKNKTIEEITAMFRQQI